MDTSELRHNTPLEVFGAAAVAIVIGVASALAFLGSLVYISW